MTLIRCKPSDLAPKILFFNYAGKIDIKQSAIFALASWANACEKKLLNLSCGKTLPRNRHMGWAERQNFRVERCVGPFGENMVLIMD